MNRRRARYSSGCLAALTLLSPGIGAAQSAAEDSALEDEALAVLKAMSDHLTSADTFTFSAVSSYDVVQPSGLTVEFGTTRDVVVGRPDRLRVESTRRDGLHSVMVFDGQDTWLFSPEHMAYASTAQRGELDEALNFVVTELRIKMPLTELVSPRLYETVSAKLTRALYLGEVALEGVDTHHLLFSNDYVDYQLWVRTGEEPTLRRIVITYREERGQPQFRTRFSDWDLDPGDVSGKLRFTPPEGAERIRFHVPGPEDAHGEEETS